MKDRSTIPERTGSVTALVLVLLFTVWTQGELISASGPSASGIELLDIALGRTSNVSSLTGIHEVSEIAYMRFLGDGTPVSNGRLGSFVGPVDIDGDGYDEMALAAPGITSQGGDVDSGITYIMNGTPELPTGDVDLQNTLLDLTLRSTSPYSAILESISSGDLNGDGHTDLVIGAPSWPDTGKICVLWGDAEGFPAEVDLVRIIGSTPNGNPVGFLRTESYAVVAGYVTTSVLGTMLGKNVLVGDLDLDGVDELIFSFHGWNSVFIVWGNTNKMQFGSQYTYLKNSLQTSQFGHSCVLGDIDGDGTLDLAISAPTADDETRGLTQVGAVSVVFDIGKVKGNNSLQIEEVARPTIYGRDTYDQFGLGLALKDVNADGKEDLLIGAPGDDGPNDDRNEAGQLMVFYGADIMTFPTSVVGIDRCDKVIYGAQGRTGSVEPDAFGSIFAACDLDGDGRFELAAGFPGKDGNGAENAGNCVVYYYADTFGSSSVTVDLSKASPRAVILGDDPYDGLGFQVKAMDLNDDSIDDLVISSPGGDGPDNDRPGAGEAYLLLGSSIVIDSIALEGEAATDGTLYTGAGNVTMSIGFRQYPSALATTSARAVIDPDGLAITITFGPDGFHEEGDLFDLVDVQEGLSSMTVNGAIGTFRVTMSVDWYYYVTEGPRVEVSLKAVSGQWVERTFNSPFKVVRDIQIAKSPTVLRNGAGLPTGHEWFSSGDMFSMSDLYLSYSDGSGRAFDGSHVSASLLRGTTVVSSAQADEEWTVGETVPEVSSIVYSLVLSPNHGENPMGFPPELGPRTGSAYSIELKVDDRAPDPPGSVVVMPDPDRTSYFDDDTDWEVSWYAALDDSSDPDVPRTLRTMDGNASGIRDFMVQVDDGIPMTVREEGGLLATYFRDGNFSEHGMMRLDDTVHFTEEDWGMWGPGPDRVPPYGFSARWDGWVRFTKDRYYRFVLSGTGQVKVMMDEATVVDWSDLSISPSTASIFRSKDEICRLTIYFKQSGPGSSISFLIDDDRGDFIPVPSGQLYHVAASVAVVLPGTGAHEVRLTAVDWAGRSSSPTVLDLTMELDPPGFNLTDYRTWHADPDPTVQLTVYDPISYGSFGSGINGSSIEYRLRSGSDTAFGDWTSEGKKVSAIVQGSELPASIRTSFKLDLTNDWSGQVQFRARDGAGNEVQSSSLFLGIDMVPPALTLLAPDLNQPQKSTGFDLILRSFDGKGSGVDGSTVGYRLRPRSSTEWGDWTLLDQTDVGPEVLSSLNLRLPAGLYDLQFRSEDTVGNIGLSAVLNLTVEEPKVDLPPVPVIFAPLEGAIYRVGFPVPLEAKGTTDDGLGRYTSLVLTWFSNISGFLGSGWALTTYKLIPGMHRITLYVDDGSPGHNVTAMVNITIKDMEITDDDDDEGLDDDGDDELLLLLAVFALVTVLIAILVIFLMLRYRARKEEEIRLEYADRSEDDDYYDHRIREEERSLGLDVEGKVRSKEEIDDERRQLYGDDES